jgi:Skp family chaperone for outer membrane proteins
MYLPVRLLVVSAILFCFTTSLPAGAETYHWVDEQGIMHFSDNSANLPRAKRAKVQVREDITISNPRLREALKESQSRVGEVARDDQEKARQRRLREAGEEQERKVYQAREKRLKEEQVKREQQEAQELKRRLDTTPVQRSAEELGGFSLSSGST